LADYAARWRGYDPDCSKVPGIESYVRLARKQDRERAKRFLGRDPGTRPG
jgi:hypothetical protein